MSRRTTVAALVGTLLLAASAPALADPVVSSDDDRETICLRTEGESGAREGICVWVPLPR